LPLHFLAFNLFGSDSEPIFEVDDKYERRKQLVHSFKNPFYLVRGTISFWAASGSTVITNDYVRLTPAEKSRAGTIWNTKPISFNSWEVEMSFKVGSTSALGADGFALWYTKDSRKEGPVFGNQDQWDGLGVIFDTFDNDGSSDNPSINVFRNDGTWSYNGGQDGKHQSLGHCRLYYRNYETQVKLTYIDGRLQILTKLQNQNDWNLCTTVAAELPQGYYFGLTAATGGLVDNHDVYKFEVTRLVGKEEGGTPAQDGRPPVYEGEYQRNRFTPPQQNKQVTLDSDDEDNAQVKETNDAPSGRNAPEGARAPAANSGSSSRKERSEVEPAQDAPAAPAAPAKPVTSDQAPSNLASLQRDVESFGKNQAALQESLKNIEKTLSSFSETIKTDTERLNSLQREQKSFTERFNTLVENLPTKDDLKNINVDNSEFGREVNQLKAQLDELKRTIESKANSAVSASQIDGLSRIINEMRGKIETSRQQQSQIENNIRTNQQQISSTIESSGSLSFWIFFVLFQAVFGVAFMWWKKYRDESTKKLI